MYFSVADTENRIPARTRKISTYTNGRMWIVWLALWGASLSKAMVGNGVSIGDILFGCAAAGCFLHLISQRHVGVFSIQKWSIYIVLLLMWGLVGGMFASSYSPFTFSLQEFWKAFSKLTFYSVGAILLGSYIRKVDIAELGGAVFNILTLNAAIALYIYVAQLLNQFPGMQLPYEFFWFGQGGPLAFGKDLVHWKIGENISR